MNKLFTFLLISLFISFGITSKSAADTNQSAFVDPLATPTPLAEIERIELDQTEVVIPCGCFGDDLPREGTACPDDALITIKTFVRNPKNTPLSYEYAVSGGIISGQGDKVVWDLTGTRPGTYTITASIKGKGKISTETRTLSAVVRECDCTCPCVCPSLVVTGGGGVNPGGSVVFIANVSGGTAIDLTYNWTVSQGEIVSGQGTPQIKVKTTREMIGTIAATVEIGGILCPDCLRTDSETATIIK
ncbi:MAG TPA: hypothetical protein VNB22_22375 [Pyrinomonadaceae bacterium]|nr:hypothetical protein [Pyrinomonadaceae bacterium]